MWRLLIAGLLASLLLGGRAAAAAADDAETQALLRAWQEMTGEPALIEPDLRQPAGMKWGYPPAKEDAIAIPEPLPCAGWHLFRGLAPDAPFAVLDGLLVSAAQDRIVAVDAASGALRWEHVLADNERYVSQLLLGEGFCAYNSELLHVLDSGSGEERWSRGDSSILQSQAQTLWITMQSNDYSMSFAGRNLLQLDASDGHILQRFACGQLMAAGRQADPQTSAPAIATADSILLVQDNGTLRELPRPLPGQAAELWQHAGGLLLAEDLPGGDSLPQCRLNWYADPLTDAKPAWTKTLTTSAYPAVKGVRPVFSGALLKLSENDADMLLRLADGEAAEPLLPPDTAQSARLLSCVGSVAIFALSQGGYWNHSLLLQNAEGAHVLELPELKLGWDPQCRLQDGRLFVGSNDMHGYGYSYYNDTSTLYCIELGENLQPRPGRTTALLAPDSHAALAAEFAASPAPLLDDELMTRIVSSGINAALRCGEQMETGSIAHWDALLAITDYMDRPEFESWERSNSRSCFEALLSWRASPELVPVLLDWLGREDRRELWPLLRGQLARCGGPQALAWLQAHDTAGFTGIHSMPEGSIRLAGQATYYTDLGEEKHNDTSWSECPLPDGTRLVAYTASGLTTQRDIYIAVDSDADGRYEECLATPWSDTFEGYSFPGGAYDIGRQQDLSLKHANGALLLGSNSLVAGDPATDEDGDGQPDEYVRPLVKYEEHPLDLAQLRQDSDGDGLTDCLEARLLTDPQNPDTDGDGLPDALDPTPNADAAAQGRVERGIARALDFFLANPGSAYTAQELGCDPSRHPWHALYLSLHGAAAVAFAPTPCAWGISISTDEQRRSFEEQLASFPAFSCWELSWEDRTQPAVTQLMSARWYPSIEDELAGMSEAELERYAGQYGYKQLPPDSAGVDLYKLTIDMPGVGYEVVLQLIDGEFYPLSSRECWVS